MESQSRAREMRGIGKSEAGQDAGWMCALPIHPVLNWRPPASVSYHCSFQRTLANNPFSSIPQVRFPHPPNVGVSHTAIFFMYLDRRAVMGNGTSQRVEIFDLSCILRCVISC